MFYGQFSLLIHVYRVSNEFWGTKISFEIVGAGVAALAAIGHFTGPL